MLLGAVSHYWKLALERWLRIGRGADIVLVGAVLGLIIWTHLAGAFERAELVAYDTQVSLRARPPYAEDRIVIIGITEADLRRFGHPLNDRDLARLLRSVAGGEPAVIGLDLYRDLPEPRSGEHYHELQAALRELPQVIGITKLASNREKVIAPPPALAQSPNPDDALRIAANNIPRDPQDGVFRRGFLFVEADLPSPVESLDLAIAREYLGRLPTPIEAAIDESGALVLGKCRFQRFNATAGGYSAGQVSGFEFLVDFRSPVVWSEYSHFSVGQVLGGKAPAGAWRDKIVLVGTVSDSVKDGNNLPVGKDKWGVAHHAAITSHILRAATNGDEPIRWWTQSQEIAWIATCTLLGGFAGFSVRSPWKLIPTIFVLAGATVISCHWLFLRAVWVPSVAPLVGQLIGAGAATSFVVLLERKERVALRTLFFKHVSPAVAETLWQQRASFLAGGRLRPQKLQATVLFTDLKGFSTTSESLKPEELLTWMNEYFEKVACQVDAQGGVINKFIGDAIMAVFGCPVPQQTDPEIAAAARAAVKCALAMERELQLLNQRWTNDNRPTMQMRIGIHTGMLVSGSVGSSERLEWTVLGDTVNTAARLESAGKETDDSSVPSSSATILISEATRQYIGADFDLRPLGAMALKGKREQVTVYRVLSSPSSP